MRLPVALIGLLQTCVALSTVNRKACQYPSRNPLDGCPKHTLVVGPGQTFTTIQSAVLSLPNNNTTTPYYILVLAGIYTEQVNITRPGPVYLLGQTSYPNNKSSNSVNVIWRAATGAEQNSSLDNAYTSVLTVAPTLNASLTGAGPTGFPVPASTPFGNADFRAYNIDFINDFADSAVGPALAVSVSYANAGFYYCGLYSYQDTVYVGKLGNAFFFASEIAGQTDFLYGFGTAWIQSSLLSLRNCGGGVTAWKGTNTTKFENRYGVYIHDSTVQKANETLEIGGKCALGRPWNTLHRSIFANTYLDDSVLAEGYVKWSATDPRVGQGAVMAEYADYGPGWNATARKEGNVTIVMDREEYEPYSTLEKVFQYPFDGQFGNVGWIDRSP
ncbi:pectin methylesteras-like protein [Clathrospora elynae]|uniref:pectinesterase n=1 Tax=Clathrospora elynae TaxID=706981 RepID=A0A6A5SWB5_9PLEO|nr:pectin methylesteras-like protein [Clathrospora elynae]